MEVKKWIEFVQIYLVMAETTIYEKKNTHRSFRKAQN